MDDPPQTLVPVPVNSIRAAHADLCRAVTLALRTQSGDVAKYKQFARDCERLTNLLDLVRSISSESCSCVPC